MSDKIDLSPFNLLICTPIADGKPNDIYSVSLDHTKQMFKEHGGKLEVFKVKYVADVAFARSKLLGAFHRDRQFTHMMFIDSDQGWNPVDIAYLLLLKRDFIGAVSCKKVYPLEFAYQMLNDESKIVPLYHEVETNVAEIPYIGGAFVMLSRNCIDRMVLSYPELSYDMPDNVIEYALFDPIIVNVPNAPRRRLSEDFAFCHRWAKIGGTVYCKMDVTLQHEGQHVFTGNLLNHLTQRNPNLTPKYAVFNGAAQ